MRGIDRSATASASGVGFPLRPAGAMRMPTNHTDGEYLARTMVYHIFTAKSLLQSLWLISWSIFQGAESLECRRALALGFQSFSDG